MAQHSSAFAIPDRIERQPLVTIPLARQHDDATRRRHDETKIFTSHFDGLIPAVGAANRAVQE